MSAAAAAERELNRVKGGRRGGQFGAKVVAEAAPVTGLRPDQSTSAALALQYAAEDLLDRADDPGGPGALVKSAPGPVERDHQVVDALAVAARDGHFANRAFLAHCRQALPHLSKQRLALLAEQMAQATQISLLYDVTEPKATLYELDALPSHLRERMVLSDGGQFCGWDDEDPDGGFGYRFDQWACAETQAWSDERATRYRQAVTENEQAERTAVQRAASTQTVIIGSRIDG